MQKMPKTDKQELRFEQMLFENFVALQRTLSNLAVKIDNLTSQISRLLQLFEASAKTFTEKRMAEEGMEKEKEFLEKIDKLLEQNKVISKGLVVMGERVRQHLPLPAAPKTEIYEEAVAVPAMKTQVLPKLKKL